MADPVEMTYVALRPLRVGGKTRQKGQLVPEATTWHNIDAYVRGGRIAPVPVSSVNPEEHEASLAAWKGEPEEELTKEELYEEAQDLDVEGRSSMTKEELSEAVEEAQEEQDEQSEELEQYHTGKGWYEIPGTDKKMRREEALEFLTSPEDDEE